MSLQRNQFRDTKKRIWTIKITVAEYMKLREEMDLDIGKVFDQENNWLADLVAQEDLAKFLEILLVVTERQRDAEGVDRMDFFEALSGEESLGDASTALIEGVINFIPGPKRDALRSVIQTMQRGLKIGVEKALENLPILEKEMEALIETEVKALTASKLKSLSSKPLESSD